MKKTKIVATLGPASKNLVKELAGAGANVIRLNMSHGTRAEHAAAIAEIGKLNARLDQPLAILLDTQGPKIRVGEVEGGRILLEEGRRITLAVEKTVGTPGKITVIHPAFPSLVKPGDPIFLADGMIELKAVGKTAGGVECAIVSGGELGSRKGVNLPNASLKLGGVTKKDFDDIAFGAGAGVDFVAVSFISGAGDVERVKEFLKRRGSGAQVIAKIETREAVDEIDEIITASDGVMVARGDLGVQLPVQEVPLIQKKIIGKCNAAAKPVIIATQMLESMTRNPRPTRAEVADVANAILDGADAVMLSEETAVGAYPIKAVETMARIAREVEPVLGEKNSLAHAAASVPEAVSKAVCIAAKDLGAKAILTYTASGSTARFISRHRPATQIIGVTHVQDVVRRLQLVWGVYAICIAKPRNTDEMMAEAVRAAEKRGFLKKGGVAVLTAGIPLTVSGNTNLMKIHVV
ncbi:MAG: pyruvate kinase [Candidatus Micrarchaeota archaeon]|nr:pyruvate kinase [Candidatus Micrarchaeota archaeon]